MSHDNADIADLSDPYRPTKIAEMFSELYDNQWTDGFAALAKLGDVEAIRKLMEMLKVSVAMIQVSLNAENLFMCIQITKTQIGLYM